MMSASNFTPYGVKSLLECMSRATLLAQPDDIPEFLHKHVEQITHFRDKDSRDIKEVAFQYQEQWENITLQKEKKTKETSQQREEESPSLVPNATSTSSTSLTQSPPSELGPRTREVSVEIPSQQGSESVTVEEMPASNQQEPAPPPPPPLKETLKTSQVSSVRAPSQKEKKPSLPSALPVIPSTPQKPPSHIRGRGSGAHTCRLTDCPYHNKPKEGSAVDRVQRSVAGPASLEVQVPYKPKGGPIADPELVPKRTREAPGTNRRTNSESTFLYGGQGATNAVPQDAKNLDFSKVSLESATYTCPHLAQSVHVIGYRCLLVQCRNRQPPSNSIPRPNLKSNHQQDADSSTCSDLTARHFSAMG